MTTYILISKSFRGHIVYSFNKKGFLVEFRNCSFNMEDEQTAGLLNSLGFALRWETFNKWVLQFGYTLLKVEPDLSYDAFDAVFGLARNRYKAEPIWNRLSAEDKTLTIWNAYAYIRYLKRHPWINQQLPSTYLINNRHDEWDKTHHKQNK